jgi:hypothetical protein
MTTDTNPLEIDEEIQKAVAEAFDSANYLAVAYNGSDGWPHLSYRGTTQVFGPQQLAIWARKRDDGLVKAIEVDPKVTLFHADLAVPQLYTFYGRARLSTDTETDERVYGAAAEQEQQQDPERKGVAVIIDLDRIQAMGARNFTMAR